jgi:L-ornithine N5-oxygenase
MSQAPRIDVVEDVHVHDLVGVGFGPANLALAVAVTERTPEASVRASAVFLERQPKFGWHRGMLIEDATMQVSFLKDLVTLRNPASEFSFLSYLHQRGRLIDFINHKSLFPLRIEFHDYLEWAAAPVAHRVRAGHEVVRVDPVTRDGEVVLLDVTSVCDGVEATFRTRNLVVATGLTPRVPDGVELGDHIWHNRDLLSNVERVKDPARFVVVGAGQSAAEVTAFLHEKFAEAEVCAVFSRYGYSPADDSSFANRIFDPAAVDDYFAAPSAVKDQLLTYHGNTNYSVVDADLIEDLYRRQYRERVLGRKRLRLLNVSRLVAAEETPEGVRAVVESLATGETIELDADVVVCATGYRPADPTGLVGPLARLCHRDERGRLRVGRDYRLVTDAGLRCGIYLQGGTEHSHGISSSLLSNASVRAGEILDSVVTRLPAPVRV